MPRRPVDGVTGQRHLQGEPDGDLALQPDHSAGGGEQAPLDLGQTEGGLVGRDDQVAG